MRGLDLKVFSELLVFRIKIAHMFWFEALKFDPHIWA